MCTVNDSVLSLELYAGASHILECLHAQRCAWSAVTRHSRLVAIRCVHMATVSGIRKRESRWGVPQVSSLVVARVGWGREADGGSRGLDCRRARAAGCSCARHGQHRIASCASELKVHGARPPRGGRLQSTLVMSPKRDPGAWLSAAHDKRRIIVIMAIWVRVRDTLAHHAHMHMCRTELQVSECSEQ